MTSELTKISFFKRLGAWLRRALEERPALFTVVMTFLVTLVIEMAGNHSVWRGFTFMFRHPLNFFTNWGIVTAGASLGFLFKKRVFFLTLFPGIWLALGIANAVILAMRVTPLGAIDFELIPSVLPIVPVYLEIWQMVAIGAGIVLLIAALVVLYIKSKKYKPRYRLGAILLAVTVALSAGSYTATALWNREKRAETFGNIANAYLDYGFVYCFLTGLFDRGIDEPGFYSRAAVDWLVGNLDEAAQPAARPNILMVQLESFFDVSYLDDVEYEGNPIPVFSSLKERYSSGFLTVPSVGAGTANTEFEVLSGMSLAFFGMGEYPYQTILKEEPCESVVRDLADLGYVGTAIHNNTGTFYNRNQVFAQLGFETFVPLECMEHVEYNPIGWAKDAVLTEEIIKAMDATENQDFIFTITVQGHGKYQRGAESEDQPSKDVTWEEQPENTQAFAYYLSQLRETDQFIGELIKALEARGEPTVLVLYGDHLPNFNIGTEQLENGDLFQTEYVIWDNLGLEKKDEDLYAYQLSARVLGDLQISSGLLTKYHQQMAGTKDYSDGLSLLEYDMLYGEYYCYDGRNPYTATDLRIGVEPVVISDASWENGVLTVSGRNFTPWSVVAMDGEEYETFFDDGGALRILLEEPPESGTVLTVRQNTDNSVVLAESGGWTVK